MYTRRVNFINQNFTIHVIHVIHQPDASSQESEALKTNERPVTNEFHLLVFKNASVTHLSTKAGRNTRRPRNRV